MAVAVARPPTADQPPEDHIEQARGSYTVNPRPTMARSDSRGGFMGRCDRFRNWMASTCCTCFSKMPSIALIVGIILLAALFVSLIPIIFFVTQQGAAEKLHAPVGEDTPDVVSEGSDWPLSDAAFAIPALSVLPPRVKNCSGFGFACTNQPFHVISTAERCDGVAQCTDGSDETDCKECQTAMSCELRVGNRLPQRFCLSPENVCDGTRHCENGEDEEEYCKKAADCPSDWIACRQEDKCLPSFVRCDGEADCKAANDEEKCEQCTRGAKMCKASGQCISRRKLCDGMVDCEDGSDEEDCKCKLCSGNKRALCANGECISRSQICDGVVDCADGTDEEKCPGSCPAPADSAPRNDTVRCEDGNKYPLAEACSGMLATCARSCPKCDDKTAFTCADGKCISKAMVCNGVPECEGGEDEEKCDKCDAKKQFKCLKGTKCIEQSARCDGVRDCADGSDEQQCDECPADALRCEADKMCVSLSVRCDGVADCPSGLDEENCSCEECLSHSSTFHCSSGACLRRDSVCSPHSQCPNSTATEKAFCATKQVKNIFF